MGMRPLHGIVSALVHRWPVWLVLAGLILLVDSRMPGFGYRAQPWLQRWTECSYPIGWGPTGHVVEDGSGVRVVSCGRVAAEGTVTLGSVSMTRKTDSAGLFTDCVDFQRVEVQVDWRDRWGSRVADVDRIRRGFA